MLKLISAMYFVICLVLFSASVEFTSGENAAADPNSAALMGEDVVSCLRDSNLTYEEASGIEFFNPNKSIPHNAKCFAACLISTDYNVSVSSEGIVEKEGLLIEAIMQDTEMDLSNATEVVDSCKLIVTAKADTCENIYNYVTCVNQKYFERKSSSNFTGNILEQYSLQSGMPAEDHSNFTLSSTV